MGWKLTMANRSILERPSAVFSIRLNQKIHHEQVLASIAELETVITLDEI